MHLAIRGVGDLRELRTAADLSSPQIWALDSGYRTKETTLIQSAAAIPHLHLSGCWLAGLGICTLRRRLFRTADAENKGK